MLQGGSSAGCRVAVNSAARLQVAASSAARLQVAVNRAEQWGDSGRMQGKAPVVVRARLSEH